MRTAVRRITVDADERYHFKLGAFECIAIKDDTEVHPISELATNVPQERVAQALCKHGFSSTELNVDFNCLLIDTGEHQVLVDAGRGQGLRRRGKLLQHLQAEGIAPQDIEFVVLTHNDSDHVGGIINAERKPVFPNARYVVWKTGWSSWSEFDWTQTPEKIAIFGGEVLRILEERGEFVEAEIEFLPGFRIIPATGHRPVHTVLAISSAGEQLLHLSDAVGHPILMTYPEWHWLHHSSPEQAVSDKRRLLERAEADNALIFGAHLPFPGLGYVARHGEGWQWQPVAV